MSIGSFGTEDHAIYISTIYLDIDDQHIEAEIRVFEDDLRDALQDHTGYVTDTTSLNFDQDIRSYFRKCFLIKDADGQSHIEWSLDTAELVGDSYRIKLNSTVDSFPLGGTMKISANYFYELFPTQKNVLRLNFEERQAYHVFEEKDAWFKFEF